MLHGTEKGRFSLMTFFAWLSIAVGIWAMSSFLSIMYGFENSLKERVLKAYPHIIIKRKTGTQPISKYANLTKKLKELNGIKFIMPFLETEIILQTKSHTLGGVLWGLEESGFERMAKDVQEGKIPTLNSKDSLVLVGNELAYRADLKIGDVLSIVSPIKTSGLMGAIPRSGVFKVSGYYSSGHYEFDQQYLFIIKEDFEELMGWNNQISGWHMWLNDINKSDEFQKKIQSLLPDELIAQSWTEFNSALFSSLKLEQYAMFVVLSFAILIAVMSISITLMMNVTQKKRNIGIMRALGATSTQIKKIFVWQGIFLGTVGLITSAVATALTVIYLRHFSHYLLPDIYYDRSVPVEIRPMSLFLIYFVAILMVFIATLYPASKASSIHPLQAIREGEEH